jgi:hypothetical protein
MKQVLSITKIKLLPNGKVEAVICSGKDSYSRVLVDLSLRVGDAVHPDNVIEEDCGIYGNKDSYSNFDISVEGLPLINGHHCSTDKFIYIDGCNKEALIFKKGDTLVVDLFNDTKPKGAELYDKYGEFRHRVAEDVYSDELGQARIDLSYTVLGSTLFDNTAVRRLNVSYTR